MQVTIEFITIFRFVYISEFVWALNFVKTFHVRRYPSRTLYFIIVPSVLVQFQFTSVLLFRVSTHICQHVVSTTQCPRYFVSTNLFVQLKVGNNNLQLFVRMFSIQKGYPIDMVRMTHFNVRFHIESVPVFQ